MKHLIVGTAGHIDHGKTELIRALTGEDTDRLKEEKERGISIDLGFAAYKISDDVLLGVVDVPGHESFIRNMLAGVSGIDLVLFVIAADEGIMPQTEEHLEILELLRTHRGVIAVTKSDLVDEDWLDLVEEEVSDRVKGTFLENSPIIRVSSKTGTGLDELKEVLIRVASELGEKNKDDLFRMPVDRTFTLKGVGTIVTGTIWSGSVRKDHQVLALPAGVETRVKSLEVHDRKVNESTAGCRTALALTGVAKDEITRGDTIVSDPAWKVTDIIDVHIECLRSEERGIRNRRRVRFHLATRQVMGRVVLLDRDLLDSGGEAYAQIRLEKPIVARKGDRFVLRSYSPIRTIGGGIVLRPFSRRRTKITPKLRMILDVLKTGDIREVIMTLAQSRGTLGIERSQIPLVTGISPGMADETMRSLSSDGSISILGNMIFHVEAVEEGRKRIVGYLEDQHRVNPIKTGFPLEEMRKRLFPTSPESLVEEVIDDLTAAGVIELKGGRVRLSSHEISLDTREMKIRDDLLKCYDEAGLAPPSLSQIKADMRIEESKLMEIITILKEKGEIIPVTREIHFSRSTVEDARRKVRDYLLENGKASASELRSMLCGSRKYIIPLLEYFDRTGLTRREGDVRVMKE